MPTCDGGSASILAAACGVVGLAGVVVVRGLAGGFCGCWVCRLGGWSVC
jgi:hypothetical protein